MPPTSNMDDVELKLDDLIDTVVKAIVSAYQTQDLDNALVIRDELQRLPSALTTEVINGVILRLVQTDPDLCRWFLLDVFLREADPDGRADVAERINLLMADLKTQQDR
ncbi:MAG: hypothetical protein KME45_05810 [Stenomitos rutilans HA7619-LM2]|nr:hypothetical protein [Stenomitos rutilans HA7619-LM2]